MIAKELLLNFMMFNREIIRENDLAKYDELVAKYVKKPDPPPPAATVPVSTTPTADSKKEISSKETSSAIQGGSSYKHSHVTTT